MQYYFSSCFVPFLFLENVYKALRRKVRLMSERNKLHMCVLCFEINKYLKKAMKYFKIVKKIYILK